jgi:hypothetical protein
MDRFTIVPAALRSRTEAGGVFKMKVKLLSCKIQNKERAIMMSSSNIMLS